MVQLAVPGERWEVEFFPDRAPEVEVLCSKGEIGGVDLIERVQ